MTALLLFFADPKSPPPGRPDPFEAGRAPTLLLSMRLVSSLPPLAGPLLRDREDEGEL
jgi:hypothetical protein